MSHPPALRAILIAGHPRALVAVRRPDRGAEPSDALVAARYALLLGVDGLDREPL